MMGIAQAFAMQGVLGLDTAVFLILGLNIGACVTPILAALGGSKTAMRTAIGILTFNIIGALLFLLAAETTPIVPWVESWTPDDPVRQLANFHTLFNVATTGIFLCMPKVLPWIAEHIIRGEDKRTEGRRLVYLAPPLPDSPTVVVSLAYKETARMLSISVGNFENSVSAFLNRDEELVAEVMETERTVNYLNHEITSELTKVSGGDLSYHDTQTVTKLLHSVMNIERISDIAQNIAQLAERRIENENKTKLGKKAMQELHVMYKRVDESLHDVVQYMTENDIHAAEMAMSLEGKWTPSKRRRKKAWSKGSKRANAQRRRRRCSPIA